MEDFAAPLLLVELDQLGVGGVGVLGDARAAPVREDVLGQVEPLLAFGQAGESVGVELVDGVERRIWMPVSSRMRSWLHLRWAERSALTVRGSR